MFPQTDKEAETSIDGASNSSSSKEKTDKSWWSSGEGKGGVRGTGEEPKTSNEGTSGDDLRKKQEKKKNNIQDYVFIFFIYLCHLFSF